MRHESKKICRIVDELTTLFLKGDTNEVDFKIRKTDAEVTIYITDYNTHLTDDQIDFLMKTLNVQRQYEVEEYYWQLCGESDDEEELTLIGSMIDKAEIEKKAGHLYMTLVRKNH